MDVLALQSFLLGYFAFKLLLQNDTHAVIVFCNVHFSGHFFVPSFFQEPQRIMMPSMVKELAQSITAASCARALRAVS